MNTQERIAAIKDARDCALDAIADLEGVDLRTQEQEARSFLQECNRQLTVLEGAQTR